MKQVLDRIRGSNLSMVRFTRVNTRTHTRTEEERRETIHFHCVCYGSMVMMGNGQKVVVGVNIEKHERLIQTLTLGIEQHTTNNNNIENTKG